MSAIFATIQEWETLARKARFRPSAVAALCAISLRQLERYFESQFHQSPGVWCRQLRCRLARELLAQGWANKVVAAELGFTDSSHLCREFKRLTGSSLRAGMAQFLMLGPGDLETGHCTFSEPAAPPRVNGNHSCRLYSGTFARCSSKVL